MSGRPLRVFLSHTSEFRDHPADGSYIAAAERAVIAAGHAVTDMQYLVAREQRPAQYCEEQVRAADVYVGVIGLRYGSPVRERPEVSYTELEFEAAVAAGIPTLVFLLDEDRENRLPPRALQLDPRQEAFRGRLRDHATVAGFGSPDELAVAVERALRDRERRRRAVPSSSVPPRTHAIVPRPEQFTAILDAVLAGGVVGVTALHGGGGFGKTTLAAEVCRNQRTQEHFTGGILWVTIGEQLAGPELAAKVNDLSAQVSGDKPTLTDPEQAGQHLGGLLGERQLLVIDDVWTAAQLRPFLAGGDGCTRLVTTRVRAALPDAVEPLLVPAMRPAEAADLLRSDLPDVLSDDDIHALLAATGGWPLLTRLVNRSVRGYLRHGAEPADAAARALRRLAAGGPAALDVRRSDDRSAAVEATLEGSLALLGENLPRYLELAVFAEDAAIPQPTLERLWGHTGGLDTDGVEALCVELADLALVEDYRLGVGLRVHDVVHQYLRHRAGHGLADLHRSLVDAYRPLVPQGRWWELPYGEPYLLGALATHLHAAGDPGLDGLLLDLRWTVRRLTDGGPADVEADLGLGTGALHERLQRAIRQNAHLLGPLEPASGLLATLLSRLPGDPELRALVVDHGPPEGAHLAPRWPLPDLADPAMIRAIPVGVIGAMALLPDGRVAIASSDGAVRAWAIDGSASDDLLDPLGDDWRPIALTSNWVVNTDGAGAIVARELSRPGRSVPLAAPRPPDDPRYWLTAAVSADGTWAAVGGGDEVRVTGTDGEPRVVLPIDGNVTALVISPDGTWLAAMTAFDARIWAADGTQRGVIEGETAMMSELAISPDGTWLAGGSDQTLYRWNADGSPRGGPSHGHSGSISSVAVGPDGAWLATASEDRTVRLWDAEGAPLAVLVGHTAWVTHVTVTAEGRAVLSGGFDQTARVWDVGGAATLATAPPRPGDVTGVGIGADDTGVLAAHRRGVRRWSRGTITEALSDDNYYSLGHTWPTVFVSPRGRARSIQTEDRRVRVVNVDGREVSIDIPDDLVGLALGDEHGTVVGLFLDGTVRCWDRTGRLQTAFASSVPEPQSIVLSDDETAIAVLGAGPVRVFGPEGALRGTLATEGGATPKAVDFGPGASWVATAGDDLRIWRADGTLLGTLGAMVWELAVSPDGTLIATIDYDRVVQVWDRISGACVAGLRIGGAADVVRWHPDGTGIVIGGEAGVYVLELRGHDKGDLHSQP